jgi:transcriptional regulator with XRE-family HTH domain
MTMGRTLDQVLAELSPARRAKVEARMAEIVAEERSLKDLRTAMSKTQVSMARKLKVGQDSVSRIEQRSDMLLSTLQGYVKALGGRLHIVAEFPDRPPVRLTELGTLAEPKTAQRRKAGARRAKRQSRSA